MQPQSILRSSTLQFLKGLALVILLFSGSAASAKKQQTRPPAKRTAQVRKAAPKRVVKRRPVRRRAQSAPTPGRIMEIQSALAEQGVYQGAPNGQWDAASMEAMKQFQAAKGLNPSGKITALSLQKLGLGSETSGLGAPRMTSSPTARLNSPGQDMTKN